MGGHSPSQPTLLDFCVPIPRAVPTWLAAPQSALERRFARFHEASPQVYRALETAALRELAQGARWIGIGQLCEQLRADPAIATAGDAFKINNSYRALYARLLLHRYPRLHGVLRVRDRREKGATAE
jgi:hypothetical protein